MKAFLLLVFTGLFIQFAGAASPAVAPPEDLPAAIQRQTAAREALSAQGVEAQAVLRKWYESALDAVRKDATGKGDLDTVLATDQEGERKDRDLTPEEKTKLPKVLRTVRDQYDLAFAQRTNQLKLNVLASIRGYIATLEVLEKDLTRKGSIEDALAVRNERESAAAELNTLAPASAAATASLPAPAAPEAAVPPPTKTPPPSMNPVGKEARPVTLQDALLNYRWSWVGRRNETDVFMTFKPDGTVSHRGMTGTWKIMGSDKLKLVQYKGKTLTLEFDPFFENYKCTSGLPDVHGTRLPK